MKKASMFLVMVVLLTWINCVYAQEKLERKTITRKCDHIILKGAKLKGNLNGKIEQMTLYSYQDGKLVPIPFQIDEITEDNHWVLPHTSPYKEDQQGKPIKLLPADGILTANDELAFMIQDAGDKAPISVFPKGWKSADELKLQDHNSGEVGWVYLIAQDAPPAPSPVDYVNYDLKAGFKKDLIRAHNFTIGFNPQVPITYALVSPNLPDGKIDNYVDRMKIRVAATLFGFVKLVRTEEDMESRLWQYKDGPVRVIRMVKSSLRLISKLQSPEINSYSVYYKNSVHLPFRLTIPFNPAYVSKDVWFTGGVDFYNRYGFKIRLNTDPRTITINGKMDDFKRNLKLEGAKWFTIFNQESAFLIYIQGLDKYPINCRFIYTDDEKTPAPPEFYPGQVPYVAFNAYNMERLQKGLVEFNVLVYILNEKVSEEAIVKLINILDNPVEVIPTALKP